MCTGQGVCVCVRGEGAGRGYRLFPGARALVMLNGKS